MDELAAALSRPERVVANPDQFKRRLAIGEDAYAIRRALKSLARVWDSAGVAGTGAGLAKSSLIAATFFAPAASMNPLVWMGVVAPAAAVTPIGWVAAAALATGGAWYGVSRWIASGPDRFVDVIPKFLNEPIDILAIKLLDLHAALGFCLAAADGRIDDSERAAIRTHFAEDWGYDPDYLAAALPLIERDQAAADPARLAAALTAFHRSSRDCAPGEMQRELMVFLREVAGADEVRAPEEDEVLALVGRTLAGARALSPKGASADLAQWGGALREAGLMAVGQTRAMAADCLGEARKMLADADASAYRAVTEGRKALDRFAAGLR